MAIPAFATPITAQGKWVLRRLTANPSKIGPIVFDAKRGVSVLVTRGYPSMGVLEWDGRAWKDPLPSNPAEGRDNYSLAWDPVRAVTVLGPGAGIWTTWVWDGQSWRKPSGGAYLGKVSVDCRLAHDPVAGSTLLFGGRDLTFNSVAAETWLLDNLGWRQVQPIGSPSPRHSHAMASDTVRKRIVLFGGTDSKTRSLDDTWEWDGTTWLQRYPAHKPEPRHGHAMAFEPKSGLTYLFGGQVVDAQNQTSHFGDTWAWDGRDWARVVTPESPAARSDHGLAFDTVRGVLVLFGGSNGAPQYDTWEYTPGTQASYTTFGLGCLGTRGAPFLTVGHHGLPYAGRDFTVQVNNLPLIAPAFMFYGLSNTQYGPLPLPFDLTPLGMTGCTLLASGDLLFPVPNILGVGLWTVPVPIEFAGRTFYNQAIVFDPTANAAGITLSNGGHARIGG